MVIRRPLSLPVVEDSQDDIATHLNCCNLDKALCGEDLTDGEYLDDDDPVDCIRCEVINEAGVPCGAPLCRLRQRIRGWRWPS